MPSYLGSKITLLLLLIASALAAVSACGPAATQPTFTKEQIIQKATEDARRSRPELGMQEAQIDEVTAQLSGSTWQVHVRGRFLFEGASPPGGKAEILEASEQYLVYDASTGRFISGRISETRPVAAAAVPTRGAVEQPAKSSEAPTPARVADAEAALRAYFATYERGDVQALWSLLSYRLRGQATAESLRRTVELQRSWGFRLVSYLETEASRAQPESLRGQQREYMVVVEIHPPGEAATPWHEGENTRFVTLVFEDDRWRFDSMGSAPGIYFPTSTPSAKAPPADTTPQQGTGPRETLDRFMSARVRRQDVVVRGLLSDGLREALETGQEKTSRVELLQVSNPCWYRYEIQRFNQPATTTAEAQVRIYQHGWGGDIMAGPPRSWEQDLSLVQTPAGWRVDQVSEPRNNREEDSEPHGLTASACNKGVAAPTPSAEIFSKPFIGKFRLTSYRRMDDRADPRGGPPVYIVDRDIEVRANVNGIKRLDVRLSLSARDTVATATAVPDANGDVVARLHLPKAGIIYVVEGLAVLSDQRPGPSGGTVNERNELIISTSAFRVMAEQE